jgi:hypothetical protein
MIKKFNPLFSTKLFNPRALRFRYRGISSPCSSIFALRLIANNLVYLNVTKIITGLSDSVRESASL